MATRTCKKCKQVIADDSSSVHCPACLFSLCLDRQSWGDYELIELLGQGGMGQVFKAKERVPPYRKIVALKRIRPGTFSPSALRRFMVEAESSANLHHPNIVTIYQYGEYDGEPFYSMAYIDGHTLREYRNQPEIKSALDAKANPKSGRAVIEKMVRIMIRVAMAVDYAHRHGILHCDLKPANIMIASDGEPHLADFGLAKFFRSDIMQETTTSDTRYDEENRPVWADDSVSVTGTEGVIAGSLHYMSPEQAVLPSQVDTVSPESEEKSSDSPKKHHRGRNVTVATDIYSLGAVFYFVLTGHPPFTGSTSNIQEVYQYLNRIRNEVPIKPSAILPSVDRDLEAICQKCLNKKPEIRYPSARALALDLENWLNNKPVEAYPVGRLGRVWRWCLREPLLVSMTTAMIAMLITATLLLIFALKIERARVLEAEGMQGQIETILNERIRREWEGPNSSVTITGDERYRLLNKPINSSRVIQVQIASHTDTSHSSIEKHIENYYALINHLEDENPANKFLLFNHQIFKNHLDAANAVISNKVDLAYLCCEAYLKVLEADPEAVPLAQPVYATDYSSAGVIFVKDTSLITEFSPQIKGSAIAFSPPTLFVANATAKNIFYELGFSAKDFSCTNYDYASSVISHVMQSSNQMAIGATHYSSVIDAIKETSIKSNATSLRIIRIISPVKSPDKIWVASSKFKKTQNEFFAGIHKGLLNTPTHIAWNVHTKLVAFTNVTLNDCSAARTVMEKARKFDQGE